MVTRQFPDESQMPRSEDGSEPIRGGSIGLNRILNTLVAASASDKRPRFSAVLLNAFTVFRNVWGMETFPTMEHIEKAFVVDLTMFLDYFDTYLSHVWNRQLHQQKYCPVIVYFPDYRHIPKEIQKDHTGKRGEMLDMYRIFLARHQTEVGLMKTMDHCRCFFTPLGKSNYPHRELIFAFRDITNRQDSIYTSGDPVAITTHIPLDLHLSYRLRNLVLLESNTGRIRPQSEFHVKLDKDGRVPFYADVHLAIGDDKLLKPLVSPKIRRLILQTAKDERWATRSQEDVSARLFKLVDVPVSKFRQYSFT